MHTARAGLIALVGVASLALLRSVALSSPGDGTLGVLRIVPGATAEPDATISVTFDRPVAGRLDETVAAASLLSIEPAVAGRAEWRDPVTLQFVPAAPLQPGSAYRVTVADRFSAVDGSRLTRPLSFTFRVAGARVLTGDPVGPSTQPRFLGAEPRLRLLMSSSAALTLLSATARVELGPLCGGPGAVRLRALGQRPISDADPGWFRYTGARGHDRARDLRRVVELTPVAPLPAGCAATLVVPARMDSLSGRQLRWSFHTYGALRVLSAGCRKGGGDCHYGPVEVVFSTPVTGAEVLRRVHLVPERAFAVRDTADSSDRWILRTRLEPRSGYSVTVDAGLRDVFGQRLAGATTFAFRTPGVPPTVSYPYGRMIVEREGFRTLAVQHVNLDTLEVAVAVVPDSLEGRFLARGWGGWSEPWQQIAAGAARRRVGVRNVQDRASITGIPLPLPDARRAAGTLLAVQVAAPALKGKGGEPPLALLQVTDLAVHARVGVDQAVVWVTGVDDGRPRRGVEVELRDALGRLRATGRTDRQGLVRLEGFGAGVPEEKTGCGEECAPRGFEGYVVARRGADRAVLGINEWDPDLSPYEFGVYAAWQEDRAPAAGAVFTERGIYRPGEQLHAKAIVRHGPLGALAPPPPATRCAGGSWTGRAARCETAP